MLCAALACVVFISHGTPVHADSSDVTVTVFIAQCTDGIDNDGDSLIDYPSDPGCATPGDDDEADVILQACEDGTDNDGDGLIDYPSDPGCDSASDTSEVNISSGGGGGGGSWTNIIAPALPSLARVTFSGAAYPGATVQTFIDGKGVASTTAASDGSFLIELTAVPGAYSFGLSARDMDGSFSAYRTVPMVLAPDSRTTVQGIALSPTLVAGASPGTLTGRTVPFARVFLKSGDTEYAGESDRDGVYSFVLGHNAEGVVTARVYARAGSILLPWSLPVQIMPMAVPSAVRVRRADMNADGRVDISDFSILLYWYRRELSPALLELERSRFNADGRIDFTDFSIMAYYWTG